jgi:hypothetical protein
VKSERVILVCDLCEGTEDDVEGVETRLLHIDRADIEAEVCTACWARAVRALMPLIKVGRTPKAKPRRLVVQGGTTAWPDTDWTFSAHALMRIGERHLDPQAVIDAVEHHEVSRPSAKLPEAYVREGGGLKVVVIPDRKVIITASRVDRSGSIEAEAIKALGAA